LHGKYKSLIDVDELLKFGQVAQMNVAAACCLSEYSFIAFEKFGQGLRGQSLCHGGNTLARQASGKEQRLASVEICLGVGAATFIENELVRECASAWGDGGHKSEILAAIALLNAEHVLGSLEYPAGFVSFEIYLSRMLEPE
jgi:hypothetical protein